MCWGTFCWHALTDWRQPVQLDKKFLTAINISSIWDLTFRWSKFKVWFPDGKIILSSSHYLRSAMAYFLFPATTPLTSDQQPLTNSQPPMIPNSLEQADWGVLGRGLMKSTVPAQLVIISCFHFLCLFHSLCRQSWLELI